MDAVGTFLAVKQTQGFKRLDKCTVFSNPVGGHLNRFVIESREISRRLVLSRPDPQGQKSFQPFQTNAAFQLLDLRVLEECDRYADVCVHASSFLPFFFCSGILPPFEVRWLIQAGPPSAKRRAFAYLSPCLGACVGGGSPRWRANRLAENVHGPANLHRPKIGRAVLSSEEAADSRTGDSRGFRYLLLGHAKRQKRLDVVN